MNEPQHATTRPTPGPTGAVPRRLFLRGAAAAGTAVALGGGVARAEGGAATAATASAPGGFPEYRYLTTLLTPSQLDYDPTGEIIFPCIRGTAGRLSGALGRYYLYYAPHDAPGGICLAHGDSLEGPFTEHPGNPIVSRSWEPHYSVSHVSSPHVMWNADVGEMWLYFHGENGTTRLARSSDGIAFDYDGVVLDTSMLPSGTTETSYARVFPHDLPDRGARYVMVFMVNNASDHRDIGWGWSPDGRRWTFDQQPLIRHSDVGAVNLSGPHLLTRNGSAFVVYHTDRGSGGNILITEVGGDFSRRDHLGVFHHSLDTAPDNGRSASPSFGTDGGVPYMVYEAGDRLGGVIAVARAD
ncbi:hypothetical protein [Streptomyces lonarensis]|uniref:hypothetical protein n=1 Tax=Streptomyces lonarensis TaxID=700599 RepID=UPI0030C70007